MPPAWRLAINNLFGRLSRTVMLVIAVAMCAGLISAVACAMMSLNLAVDQRIKATVGSADLRIRHVGNSTFERSILDTVRVWKPVAAATGRVKEAVVLRRAGLEPSANSAITCFGVDPEFEGKVRPYTLIEGRYAKAFGEVVLDEPAVRELKAKVGDDLTVDQFGEPVTLRVVGIIKPPPLGAIISREECFVTLETIDKLATERGRLSDLDIVLKPGFEPDATAKELRATGGLPSGVLLQLTEKITSGLNKNLESNQIGFYLASVLAFMAAAFIIATGMTTGVTERTRELAILRCVGAQRRQLASAQLIVGVMMGFLGALVGVPMGVLAAFIMVKVFPEQLPGGFALSPLGIGMGFGGALLAGVFGAAFPALAAARVSPLEGLALRSKAPNMKWAWACLFVGLAGLATQLALMKIPADGNTIFWSYVLAGLPSMVTGYFLLGVPVSIAIAKIASGPISRLLRLPGRMLERATGATPFRHGFTAASMMLGLAMMVAIWTNGRAVLRDWLDALALPDAFIYGHNLKGDIDDKIRKQVPEVAMTCAITVQNVDTNFKGGSGEKLPGKERGVRGLGKYTTSFVGFEPESFFAMTKLNWEQGDQASATRRLKEGGAVIVSREFCITRGFKLGDKLDIKFNEKVFTFDVVGVVSSPGLDVVSKFLEVGEQYMDQSVNAICGSRADLISKFENNSISFVQMQFKEGVNGKDVLKRARIAAGQGVLFAVTAAEMKQEIRVFIGGALFVMSVVAIGAMLVACLSVANLIIAAIQARQFEFGVLRAVGAERGLLGRLVLGEAILISLAACVLGTAMGLQGAWAGQNIHRVILGTILTMTIEWGPIIAGWGTVVAVTVLASMPAIWRLVKKHPRELLAAVKG